MTPKPIKKLSVVIPCFNEAENIAAVLQEWCEVYESHKNTTIESIEFLVIDDGSTDETAAMARVDMQSASLRIIRHASNKGYGAALQSGFHAATGEWVVTFDGDAQYDPRDFEKLWIAINENGADIAAGYRVKRSDNVMRIFNGRAWTWLMNSSLRLKLKDLDSSFKLYRSDTLRKALPLTSTGAFMWAELFHSLKLCGATIVQVPINHRIRQYGTPSGNSPAVVVRAFVEWMRYLISKS